MRRIPIRPMAALAALVWLGGAPPAGADEFMDRARHKVEMATRATDSWDGPTSGPRAAGPRTIVFVAADLGNGGIVGVSRGVEEAGRAIGWTVRVIDGQGTVSGRAAALAQALDLRPAGIVVGGFDTAEHPAAFAVAARSGVALVGWHSGARPGPDEAAGLFANVTTTADEVSEAAALWAVADSAGKAGVVIFTDSQYAIAVHKAKAMEAVIRRCGGCTVLSYEDSPIAESASRMPALTASLLRRLGHHWTHTLAINDRYFDFMGPTLDASGLTGGKGPRAVSAGDGSEAAYQRIRAGLHQAGTVPEPLNMQGWQIVDELNRAFAGQAWSGYVPRVHLVTPTNVGRDGGPRNLFDPDNGYREQYRRIWGTK